MNCNCDQDLYDWICDSERKKVKLVCVSGPVGPSGHTGPTGSIGETGAAGSAGIRGPDGVEGNRGPMGDQGPQGDRGPEGPTGESSRPGSTGPTGPDGPIGPYGPTGPRGPTGLAIGQFKHGPTGPTGPIGPTGVVGTVPGSYIPTFTPTSDNSNIANISVVPGQRAEYTRIGKYVTINMNIQFTTRTPTDSSPIVVPTEEQTEFQFPPPTKYPIFNPQNTTQTIVLTGYSTTNNYPVIGSFSFVDRFTNPDIDELVTIAVIRREPTGSILYTSSMIATYETEFEQAYALVYFDFEQGRGRSVFNNGSLEGFGTIQNGSYSTGSVTIGEFRYAGYNSSSGSTDQVGITYLFPPISSRDFEEFTISFWLNFDDTVINSTLCELITTQEGGGIFVNPEFDFSIIQTGETANPEPPFETPADLLIVKAGPEAENQTKILHGFTDGTVHHIAYTAKNAVLYIDGIRYQAVPPDFAAPVTLNILKDNSSTNQGIDDFALWNRHLDFFEIQSLYGGGTGPTGANAIDSASTGSIIINHPLNLPNNTLDYLLPGQGALGEYVVYTAGDTGSINLYSVKIEGGVPVKLNNNGTSVSFFTVAPNGFTVVFTATDTTDSNLPLDLYGNQIDGQFEARILAVDVRDSGSGVLVSPDSKYIVYPAITGELSGVKIVNLFSQELRQGLGSTGTIKQLSNVLVLDESELRAVGELRDDYKMNRFFFFSSNNTYTMAYVAQQSGFGYELFTVPVDGSVVATPITINFVNGQEVRQFDFTVERTPSNSNQIVYIANDDDPDLFELYISPINGAGNPTKLSNIQVNERVIDFKNAPNPDASFVAYRVGGYLSSSSTSPLYIDLYTVSDSGENNLKRNARDPLFNGPQVTDYDIEDALPRSYRITVNQQPVQIFKCYIVYLSDEDQILEFELYSFPYLGFDYINQMGTIDPKTKINGPLAPGGSVGYGIEGIKNFEITRRNVSSNFATNDVIYVADQVTSGVKELFSSDMTGSSIPTLPLNNPGNIKDGLFTIYRDNDTVVYIADYIPPPGPDADNIFQLYSAEIGNTSQNSAQQLNLTFLPGKNVLNFKFYPNRSNVVYQTDQITEGIIDLVRTNLI